MAPKAKRRRIVSCTEKEGTNFSGLHPDLLQLILSKLSFMEILHFKAVCSSWRSTTQSFLSSLPQLPCLLLPTSDQESDHAYANVAGCFFSLEVDKRVCKINNVVMGKQQFGSDSWWVGSSHGWLVLLGRQLNPFLLNPFSQARIELPLMDSLAAGRFQASKSYLMKSFIVKAVLLSDPSRDKNYGAVVIYNHGPVSTGLAFYKNGDCKWNVVSDIASQSCHDIMYHNNLVYVLTYNFTVQVWDFHGSWPVKEREIKTSAPRKTVEAWASMRDLYSCQIYLVESSGDLLLAWRFRGNFVNEEGEAVYEADTLTDEDTHPLVCPYRTLKFHVYKLDFNEKKWVEVEDLNGRVLFLGGSPSMSVSVKDFPGCERNSIYFTDDNWAEMDLDYLYGGHDFGMFSLQDKIVKPFYACNSRKIVPPPVWIVPNPW